MSGQNIHVSVEVREQIRVETVSQDDHGNNTTDSETVYCRSDNTNVDNSLRTGMSSASSTSHPVVTLHLSRGQRLIAGSGHILNDLCASLWFTYFLLYMQKVVKFNDSYAAALLFWGQVR